jgi:hypothetical protein
MTLAELIEKLLTLRQDQQIQLLKFIRLEDGVILYNQGKVQFMDEQGTRNL